MLIILFKVLKCYCDVTTSQKNICSALFLSPNLHTEEQKAEAKTAFYKELAEVAHRFYGGKMQTVPKAGLFGFNWFNAWYTPGVSRVSTTIRDNTTSRCS